MDCSAEIAEARRRYALDTALEKTDDIIVALSLASRIENFLTDGSLPLLACLPNPIGVSFFDDLGGTVKIENIIALSAVLDDGRRVEVKATPQFSQGFEEFYSKPPEKGSPVPDAVSEGQDLPESQSQGNPENL